MVASKCTILGVDSIDVLTFHFLPLDFCLPPMKTTAFLTIALRLALMASVSPVAFQVADCVPARASDHHGVARWEFGTEEITRVAFSGSVQRDARGPRPPMFPDFSETNTAIKLNGDGAHVVIQDTGASSPFDFTNGDSITIESWVLIDQIGDGENRYVIGKGRTHQSGFDRDNQNWGLRLSGVQGKGAISFLFATPRSKSNSVAANSSAHWHRWTSKEGFAPETGWHHVAVAYRFGSSDSVRGWIDGVPVVGQWDMGGPTNESPVSDNDNVWIGASMGGIASTSFQGSLDSIALHRDILTDEVIKTRYRREGPVVPIRAIPERAPDVGVLPPGLVFFSAHENMPTHTRWINEGEAILKPTMVWSGKDFLLPRLPFRYDAWGIRDSWSGPVLLRMAADVPLTAGEHRILLRARGLSRLWLGEQIIAKTKTVSGQTDGHQPVLPIADPPIQGLQPAGYEMQEAIQKFSVPSEGTYRLVLESILGGKKLRAVPGDMCVAIETADGASFTLLQPSPDQEALTHLTDENMTRRLEQVEQTLQRIDDETRRSLSSTQNDYWTMRHDFAKQYSKEHPVAQPQSLSMHPIDSFIEAKLERVHELAKATPTEDAAHFQRNVLPILSENCFRCHGKKESGGLRLNQRELALKGGDSGEPAFVPGSAHASAMMTRIRSSDLEERMPPGDNPLNQHEISILEDWIQNGANWYEQLPAPDSLRKSELVGDEAFLRRLTLDTIGLPPTEAEVRNFVADSRPDKRERAIDRLLDDPRWADHWVSYWQEVLAENPNMLKPSLNNSGPFRWFLHEAFRDGKSMDRIVTELILLRGSEREGGAAGFGLAADNDAPFAAKAHIVGTAFLGVELQCARCHDSPYHRTKQKDLYSLAAMFERKSVKVPSTSTVPAGFFEKKDRESLIKVTLKPSESIEPVFPFTELLDCHGDFSTIQGLMRDQKDSRELLATVVTAPQNKRFAQVIANRLWRRFVGAGIVEPPHDWEGQTASHPEMLDWLGAELVSHNYDLKHLSRVIFTSKLYQREAIGQNLESAPEQRLFLAPDRRRLTAEQIVDSMYAAAGHRIDVEEITFDPDGRRAADAMISLGRPKRAWMFASLSNERDRPSLSLPKAQAVSDVLEAFGWTGARQNPRTDREISANVLQSGVLANSVVSTWITRASHESPLAELALKTDTPESLVEAIFMRFLGRRPSIDEQRSFVPALSAGFSERKIPDSQVRMPVPFPRLAPVTWSNHLMPEANEIQVELEKRARAGAPVDPRIEPKWRETYEDFVWSVLNTREFVWIP